MPQDDQMAALPSGASEGSSASGSTATAGVAGEAKAPPGGAWRCWAACPRLHGWARERTGTPASFFGVLGFLLLDGLRWGLEEASVNPAVNPQSISVMSHLLTLAAALLACIAMDRWWAIGKLADSQCFWRWGLVAAILAASYYLQAQGVRMHLDDRWVGMLSYANVPISIAVSYFALGRRYGKLEGLAAAMMTLGIGAFINLRVSCTEAHCRPIAYWEDQKPLGIVLILASILAQMVAWTFAERILKSKSQGVIRAQGCRRPGDIRVMLVHLSFCQLLIHSCSWVYNSVTDSHSILGGLEERPPWFGTWEWTHCAMVVVYMLHMFLSCHMIKHFSVVSWVLTQVVSSLLADCISDPIFHKFHFEKRALQSSLIAPAIVLSAVIFQTGRLNILALRRRFDMQKPEPQGLGCSDASQRDVLSSAAGASPHRATPAPAGGELEAGLPGPSQQSEEKPAAAVMALLQLLAKYSCVIIYILAQALRENLSQKAQSGSVIVPQSLNVASAFFGLLLACITTFCTYGWTGLWQAWNFRKILRAALPALFFALSSFLGSMAFAMGTSAAAKDAAGRVYTPVAAILSRWILGKFYMWLEWLALIILTVACMTFGLLDTMEVKTQATLGGLLCAVGSGGVAALNSLVMEKLMKKEADPFVVQNVRLTFGSLVFNIIFLFVMGLIGDAESPPRPDFGFWNYRPGTSACGDVGRCDEGGVFMFTASLQDGDPTTCRCDKGVFVGWDSQWYVYAALASAVVYSWVTGLVVKNFSSVYRSVADGLMLMVVYFALTPLFDGVPFPVHDLAKSFVVLIVPLSGTTFSYAASEMQKVMRVAECRNTSTEFGKVASEPAAVIKASRHGPPPAPAGYPTSPVQGATGGSSACWDAEANP